MAERPPPVGADASAAGGDADAGVGAGAGDATVAAAADDGARWYGDPNPPNWSPRQLQCCRPGPRIHRNQRRAWATEPRARAHRVHCVRVPRDGHVHWWTRSDRCHAARQRRPRRRRSSARIPPDLGCPICGSRSAETMAPWHRRGCKGERKWVVRGLMCRFLKSF